MPGADGDVAARLERALASVGRPACEDGPVTLRWQLRRRPSLLIVEERVEALDAMWDPAAARALSGEWDGFVLAMDSWSYLDRQAAALFFSGRTLDLVEQSPLGMTRIPDPGGWIGYLDGWERHMEQAQALLGDSHYWLTGEVAEEGEWRIGPPAPFESEVATPVSRLVILGYVAIPDAPGRRGQAEDEPDIALSHDGPLGGSHAVSGTGAHSGRAKDAPVTGLSHAGPLGGVHAVSGTGVRSGQAEDAPVTGLSHAGPLGGILAVPGVQVRSGQVGGAPFTVVSCPGPLGGLPVAEISAALPHPVFGFDVPGGGAPSAWVHAEHGRVLAAGTGGLLPALRRIADAPALLFGA
ncbi:hypothetical protein [Actinomadura macrotermitis]|uniref:hypothetical protein n=1 Tax=Actinomadura macrotermitis TaxID=2585200 RepID=UPI00129686CB|nr:hypothetical protein [Actinomadura macrotermitis]